MAGLVFGHGDDPVRTGDVPDAAPVAERPRLQTSPKHPEAVAEARATIAGFYLGVGVSAVLMAQFFLWFALGVCWAIAAFGRIISIISDGGNTLFNWIAFLVDVLLAAGPLLYVFGFIA